MCNVSVWVGEKVQFGKRFAAHSQAVALRRVPANGLLRQGAVVDSEAPATACCAVTGP
jgi:hypothetical protein